MNKAILAGIAAGVLLVGLILSPVFSGNPLSPAQAQSGEHKKVTLIASEKQLQVAPNNALHPGGIIYNAMVFNGTIPGPVISVDQGDTLEITLINEGKVIHSLDFHAGFGPTKALSGNVAAGESKTWTLEAVNAGVFLYHCGADGLNGVWEHIANGMYGGIVVHPKNEAPAKEFYVVFGEIYNSRDGGPFVGSNGEVGSFDIGKLWNDNPDLILTNGMAHKYVPSVGSASVIPLNDNAEIFKVKPGELTRWYIVNPGPNGYVAFHFIAGMIDVRDGSIKNRYGTQLKNDETWTIPPGSATVIEAVFPEEGIYVGVDHNMGHVLKGGAFAVLATPDATDDDHPAGTKVPPKGSDVVSFRNDFDIADAGITDGKLWMTVNGIAGGTTPTSLSEIYAYVFATDAGIFAATSHGVEDSDQVANDLFWHTHKVELDSNNCIVGIQSTPEQAGTVLMKGNMVEISGSGATTLNAAMAVGLTINQNICVSEVFDSQ